MAAASEMSVPLPWAALTPRHLPLDRNRFDPYLVMADSTGFEEYLDTPPDAAHQFPVSIELVSAALWPMLFRVAGLRLRPAHEGSRFVTGMATMAAYARVAGDPSLCARIQCAQALRTRRHRVESHKAQSAAAVGSDLASGTQPEGNVLLGVIDHGCPFAHRDLRGKDGTRILRLWNQNEGSAMGGRGKQPSAFGYGVEFDRLDLNALMGADGTGSPAINEDACYRQSGYLPVLRRHCHGAHALGLLAGTRRWDSRPNARQPMLPDRSDEPSTPPDIVFVQLPQELMDCVTVPSLAHRALDGFRYIYQIGKEGGCKDIVVSFAYESWLGPHNGTTWFESALDALVNEAESQGIALHICMIAGNAKNKKAHAAITCREGTATVSWWVPPDQEVPTLVEVWIPPAVTTSKFSVSLPDGRSLAAVEWGSAVAWPEPSFAKVCLVAHDSQVLGREMRCVVLRIAPTRSSDAKQTAAPHGIWSLKLDGVASKDELIHAYLGRVEPDAAAPRRARQPVFVGRTTEDEIALDRRATINGHACGQKTVVVGAYHSSSFLYSSMTEQYVRGRSTDYSGAGPSNGIKPRPDVSIAVDEGIYHAGVLGMGTRSANVYRMSGTSAAAPLWARRLVAAPLQSEEPQGKSGSPTGPNDPALGDVRRSPFAV